MNVNEKIRDRTIRHAIFLERYKKNQVGRIRRILDRDILPEIASQIERRLTKIVERGSDTGAVTTRRLKQLEKELKRLTRQMSVDLKRELTLDLDKFSKSEIEWQINAIKESLDFDLEYIVPSGRSVAKIIKNTSFAGSTLDQWFDSLAQSTQRKILREVNRGIVEGQTTGQIMQRVRGTRQFNYKNGVMETTRRQAEAVTRTVINHSANQSRLELFKENEDIIKGLQWVATLDSRTSLICAGLDGKVFPVDKGQRPPAHVNCRSTMTPVLKPASQLGLKNLTPGQRASINGQVPASTTFGKWLKGQPVSVQNEVLGVKKAKLFRDGDLSIERFTDSNLRPLNLEQLEQIEKKAFDKAGL